MALVYNLAQHGIVIPGTGPAGTLTVFTLAEERAYCIYMFVSARSDGQSSFSAYLRYTWENDDGFAPVNIGTPTKTLWRGVGAADWDIDVEVKPGSINELRVQASGTAASQVRWDIHEGQVYETAAPEVDL